MLTFFIVLVIIAAAVQIYVTGQGFNGISYKIYPQVNLAEPDEVFDVCTEIDNGTRRFIPFISLNEYTPKETDFHSPGVRLRPGIFSQPSNVMTSSVYLMPKQRLQRRIKASLPQRGRYFFGGASLAIGDFLGLNENYESFHKSSEIVIIPKLYPIEALDNTLGGFLGDISVNRFILEDPVLTLGFREYTMREPMKSIAWSQTARTGQLMVKKYDYTLELTVTVILNVEVDDPLIKDNIELIEKCYSISRTVCETLEEQGIKYDFATNAHAAGSLMMWNDLGEGLGARHLSAILEGLGRATHTTALRLDIMLERVTKKAQHGRSYIIITPYPTQEIIDGAMRLQDLSGGRQTIIYAREV